MTTRERKLEMYIKDMKNSIAEYHSFYKLKGTVLFFKLRNGEK